jgi:hypothetical protein
MPGKLLPQVLVLSPSLNLDQDTRLTIRVGGENFFLICGKGGVSGDQNSHNTTSSFQPQGQELHPEAADLAFSHYLQFFTIQDSSTVGNSLTWIDVLVELLPNEKILQ